jgi:hypothetical protein
LAYLKRPELWPAFVASMSSEMTVRRTASALGVCAETALRWRHRRLADVRNSAGAMLSGDVIVGQTSLPFSEKGRRNMARPARKRSHSLSVIGWPAVWLHVACDEGHSIFSVLGSHRAGCKDLDRVLLPRLSPGTTLLGSAGPASPWWSFARLHGVRYSTPARGAGDDPRPRIHDEVRRLRWWLRRFRGVATRYLSNYLVWRELLDAQRGSAGAEVGSRSSLDLAPVDLTNRSRVIGVLR